MQIHNLHGLSLPNAQRPIDPTLQSLSSNLSLSSGESFQQLLPGNSGASTGADSARVPSDIASRPLDDSNSATPVASEQLREAFRDFVGQTFFSELIKSYRSTQQPAAYFNGGQAEKIFQGQLDQVLSEALSKSSAEKIADPMFELFMMDRAG